MISELLSSKTTLGQTSAGRPAAARSLASRIVAGIGRGVLLGTVLLPAWFFGGVLPGGLPCLLVAIAGVLAILLLWQAISRFPGMVLPKSLLPLACAIFLGAFQLLPLDRSLLEKTSSQSAIDLRQSLARGSQPEEQVLATALSMPVPEGRKCLSLYPAATRRDLALFAMCIGVFIAGAWLFRSSAAQMCFCSALAVHGTILAFFGVTQLIQFGEAWRKLWTVAASPVLPGLNWSIGPLVNRNHDGGFLNLCLAGAGGLLLWAVGRTHPCARARFELPLLALCAASTIIAGVLCTFSRGAAVSMAVAGLITGAATLAAKRGSKRLWWGAIAVVCAAALVAWIGMDQSLRNRLASFSNPEKAASGRMALWADSLKAVPDFPWFGSGLGTFQHLYPVYQDRTDENLYVHAENHYVEVLMETGILGISMLAAFIGMAGWACWKLLRRASDARTTAFAAAAIFALTAHVVHAVGDFCLYVPANLALFALWSGAVCGSAADPFLAGAPAKRPARWLPAAVSLIILGICGWGWLAASRWDRVAAALRQAEPLTPTPDIRSDEVLTTIRRLAGELDDCPDHAEGLVRLSDLEILLFQSRTFEHWNRDNLPKSEAQSLWRATSPYIFYGRLCASARSPDPRPLNNLRRDPAAQNALIPALHHAIQAADACPLLPNPHVTQALLCGLIGSPSDNQVFLARARRVASSSLESRFRCGMIEFYAGRIAPACRDWQRTLWLCNGRGPLATQILNLAFVHLTAWQLLDMLPMSPELLINISREHLALADRSSLRAMVSDRIRTLANEGNYPASQRFYFRGMAHSLAGEPAKAVDDFRNAVEEDPLNVGYRTLLARECLACGKLNLAREQLAFCAQYAPKNTEWQPLLAELNRKAATSIPPKD